MTLRTKALKENSGSPMPGEPEYLLVGTFRRPHGLRGDLLMEVVTDFPERLRTGTEVFVGVAHERHVIAATRQHSGGMLVRLQGLDTADSAGVMRKRDVYVRGANRPALPKGQYYHHELLGSTVLDRQGTSLGYLSEILETGANDVFVVRMADERELLLPVIDTVVEQIDPAQKTIRVFVPDGLLPESPRAKSSRATPGKRCNARRG
jgi:16S rRNA processing protein RimM